MAYCDYSACSDSADCSGCLSKGGKIILLSPNIYVTRRAKSKRDRPRCAARFSGDTLARTGKGTGSVGARPHFPGSEDDHYAKSAAEIALFFVVEPHAPLPQLARQRLGGGELHGVEADGAAPPRGRPDRSQKKISSGRQPASSAAPRKTAASGSAPQYGNSGRGRESPVKIGNGQGNPNASRRCSRESPTHSRPDAVGPRWQGGQIQHKNFGRGS